jgi:AcrR family transcriptional regulator
MARPVGTDDDAMLDAAGRALSLYGPSAFTLAKAGEQAGIAAATLVKRFGSKRALFLRLSQRWVARLEGDLAVTEARAGSPLDRVRAVALHNYHDLDNPATAARQLAALAVDLQDDELRELLHSGWSIVRTHLERQVADAIAAGQLAGCPPPDQLARILFTAMEGGCLSWSVHPDGSLIARLTADLDALLAAWTTPEESR